MTSARRALPLWLDILLTALAPAIWGSTYITTTHMLPPDRPFMAGFLRCLPAGLLLLAYACHWPARGYWGRLIVLAALNFGLFQPLLFVGAYRLPGGLAAVVGAVQPLLVMGLAWALDGKRPVFLAVLAALAGVGGMAMLLLAPNAVWDSIGIAAALAGAASMAAGTFLTRHWRNELPILASTGWQLLLGGLLLAPLAWALDPPLPALSATNIAGYAYLSLVGALLTYLLWFRGLSRLPSVAVSSLLLLSPVTAVIIGWTVLDQSMRGLSLAGLVLVLGSILSVQLLSRPK